MLGDLAGNSTCARQAPLLQGDILLVELTTGSCKHRTHELAKLGGLLDVLRRLTSNNKGNHLLLPVTSKASDSSSAGRHLRCWTVA